MSITLKEGMADYDKLHPLQVGCSPRSRGAEAPDVRVAAAGQPPCEV